MLISIQNVDDIVSKLLEHSFYFQNSKLNRMSTDIIRTSKQVNNYFKIEYSCSKIYKLITPVSDISLKVLLIRAKLMKISLIWVWSILKLNLYTRELHLFKPYILNNHPLITLHWTEVVKQIWFILN